MQRSHYLVDAYNFLFLAMGKRGTLENRRQRLIDELNEAVSKHHLYVTLVFDGSEEHLRGHYDALEIVYTRQAQTADEYILNEVMHAKHPSQITVVSNDRELTGRSRQHRAKTLTISQFIAYLAKKKMKQKKRKISTFRESDPEMARLLAIFEKKFIEKSENH